MLLPKDNAGSDEAENENVESCAIREALQTEDLPEEGRSPQACAFFVGDDTGPEVEDEESNNEREASV